MQKLFPIVVICLSLMWGGGSVFAQERSVSEDGSSGGVVEKTGESPQKDTPKPFGKTDNSDGDGVFMAKRGANATHARRKKRNKRRGAKKAKKEVTEEANESADNGPLPDEVTNAVEDLTSADPDVVIEAVQILGATGNPRATAPLLKLLKTGPRSDITDAILFALATVRHDDAIPVLLEYLHHRRSDARIAAIMALENDKSDEVTKAIEGALADSDRQVRATAAMALGKRGDKRSVPILFLAFERGVTEAASAIGQIGTVDDSKRLTHYLGKEDIKVMLSGFDEFLKRADFPEDAKLNILNRLFDLAGPEVWRFAVTYKASFPPDTDENENRVYKLVCRMVRQIKDK
jgi:hypothetical protein